MTASSVKRKNEYIAPKLIGWELYNLVRASVNTHANAILLISVQGKRRDADLNTAAIRLTRPHA